MEKIIIPDKQNAEEQINSTLFLKYMLENGFAPNEDSNILELFQSANGSMSQYLKECRQYLLSRRVLYPELDEVGIDGAYGYFERGEIVVPKTLGNDARFLYGQRLLYRKHGYGAPTINEFDTMIGNGYSESMYDLASFTGDKYLGVCKDSTDADLQLALERYKTFCAIINSVGKAKYEYIEDTIGERGKTLCLVKKKDK